jgi:NAD(P)-dependent dehydrogenase (short-subunit alcohol dehydrogenase family)
MNILLFGATGNIGATIRDSLHEKGTIFCGTREYVSQDIPALDVVIWSQGANTNDTIGQLDEHQFDQVMDANLYFVIRSLDYLLKTKKIKDGARLCIISSVWQDSIARPNKFSYTVSKAALGGLVRSAAVDLKQRNILVNAILPGPIDNEMTRSNLTLEQIQKLPGFTDARDICHMIDYMCFKNTSMTGQSIVIDQGFSLMKI